MKLVDDVSGIAIFGPYTAKAPTKPVMMGRLQIPKGTAKHIPKMEGISRSHFVLQWEQGGRVLSLKDNKSVNGVLVNGHRISTAKLKVGDTVLIGAGRHVQTLVPTDVAWKRAWRLKVVSGKPGSTNARTAGKPQQSAKAQPPKAHNKAAASPQKQTQKKQPQKQNATKATTTTKATAPPAGSKSGSGAPQSKAKPSNVQAQVRRKHRAAPVTLKHMSEDEDEELAAEKMLVAAAAAAKRKAQSGAGAGGNAKQGGGTKEGGEAARKEKEVSKTCLLLLTSMDNINAYLCQSHPFPTPLLYEPTSTAYRQ